MWKSLKRRPVLLALLVMLGGLALELVFLPGGRVTRANCERVQKGMTEAEVRDILGKPWEDSLLDPEGPGDDDSIWKEFQWEDEHGSLIRGASYWMGSDVGIYVAFDGQSKVAFTKLCTDPDRPRSSVPVRVWRRLRARLGW
jgi:hypothetical protein